MKKFYLHNGTEQQGPFDIEELMTKNISKDTPIWHEGFPEWMAAEKVDELKEKFNVVTPPAFVKKQTPPPFEKKETTPPIPKPTAEKQMQLPKKKKGKGLWIGLIIGIILVILAIMITNNPNSIPGISVKINTPKPSIINQRFEDVSTLFKAKVKVIGLIQNQGGDGNVFVTFHVSQGGKSFDKSQQIYLRAGASQELTEEFREVTRLGGDFSYRVDARSE